jgi:hypothetical protein
MISSKLLIIAYPILVALLLAGAEQPKAPVESQNSAGPRVLEEQTRTSVVRDYLQAWQGLDRALSENRPDALDECFVGIAKEKLADTIREQKNLGIQAMYRDQTHDLEVVFYSPDGLSIQLLDKVGYRLEIRDHGRVVGGQQVQSRYVAVMTPTEARWKVRILQAEPQ